MPDGGCLMHVSSETYTHLSVRCVILSTARFEVLVLNTISNILYASIKSIAGSGDLSHHPTASPTLRFPFHSSLFSFRCYFSSRFQNATTFFPPFIFSLFAHNTALPASTALEPQPQSQFQFQLLTPISIPGRLKSTSRIHARQHPRHGTPRSRSRRSQGENHGQTHRQNPGEDLQENPPKT